MTGFKCALGQQFLGKDNAATVDHYVSVLRTLSKESQVCYHDSACLCQQRQHQWQSIWVQTDCLMPLSAMQRASKALKAHGFFLC